MSSNKEVAGCEFCGIKENCNNYKLGLIEGREGYVKLEDVDSLFRNIRLMILDMDEESHNWNKNNVAGTVFNSYLFFKKALAQNQNKEVEK